VASSKYNCNFLILSITLLLANFTSNITAKETVNDIAYNEFSETMKLMTCYESNEEPASNLFRIKFISGNILYFTDMIDSVNNSPYFELNIISTEHKKMKLFFNINDLYPHILKRSYSLDFLYWNDKFYILAQHYIYIFSCSKNFTEINYIGKSNLIQFGHQRIDKFGNSVIIYNCSSKNGLYGKPKSNTYYTILDTMNFQLSETVCIDDPHGFEWTYIKPRELIAVSDSLIAFSDADKYNIRIYKNDSLKFNIFDSSFYNTNVNILDKSQGLKKGILDLYENSTLTNLITSIEFLNNDTLIVLKSIPDTSSENKKVLSLFDIWIYYDNDWKLSKGNLKVCNIDDYQSNDKLDENFLFSPYNYSLNNGYFITLIDFYPFALENIPKMLKSEYLLKLEEFYKLNDLKFKYLIYKLK